MIYPIIETFYSLKGEGVWTGKPMVFIRLHGCNLECSFCDTRDDKTEDLTPSQLLHRVRELSPSCDHVVITGGEPMIRDLRPLATTLREAGYMLHLETNGTETVWSQQIAHFDWVAVSPKHATNLSHNVIIAADEIKFLCGQDDWSGVIDDFMDKYKDTIQIRGPILYLMPVAKSIKEGDRTIKDILWDNVETAIQYCREHTEFSLCMQLHKTLGIP